MASSWNEGMMFPTEARLGRSALMLARIGWVPICGNGHAKASSVETYSALTFEAPPAITAAAAMAGPSLRTLVSRFLIFMSSSSSIVFVVLGARKRHRPTKLERTCNDPNAIRVLRMSAGSLDGDSPSLVIAFGGSVLV